MYIHRDKFNSRLDICQSINSFKISIFYSKYIHSIGIPLPLEKLINHVIEMVLHNLIARSMKKQRPNQTFKAITILYYFIEIDEDLIMKELIL